MALYSTFWIENLEWYEDRLLELYELYNGLRNKIGTKEWSSETLLPRSQWLIFDELFTAFTIKVEGESVIPEFVGENWDYTWYHEDEWLPLLAPFIKQARIFFMNDRCEQWGYEVENGILYFLKSEITFKRDGDPYDSEEILELSKRILNEEKNGD